MFGKEVLASKGHPDDVKSGIIGSKPELNGSWLLLCQT
jgi:hypothetical protein